MVMRRNPDTMDGPESSPDRFPLAGGQPASSFTAMLGSLGQDLRWNLPPGDHSGLAPEATTILALQYADGVAMIGDRQATEGYTVAHRRVQKVFPADRYSAVAISGTAGLALELVRLFQTELEHYEKLEGTPLSLEGQANHLAGMVRQYLPLVFQGLVVIPLFCGYDRLEERGRLYAYDVVGGRYEEQQFGGSGSGGREAKSYLRSVWEPGLPEDRALRAGLGALIAAAEEDTATGGPDLRRGIFPNVVTVTAGGYQEIGEGRIGELIRSTLEEAV